MKIKPGFKLRKMCGSSVVVSVGKEATDFNGIITLNDSGEKLWSKLSEGAELDDLIALLLSEYDVDRETAAADAAEFVAKADKAGLLEH